MKKILVFSALFIGMTLLVCGLRVLSACSVFGYPISKERSKMIASKMRLFTNHFDKDAIGCDNPGHFADHYNTLIGSWYIEGEGIVPFWSPLSDSLDNLLKRLTPVNEKPVSYFDTH